MNLKDIYKSLGYCILLVFWGAFTIDIIDRTKNLIYDFTYTFKNCIIIGFVIFVLLLSIIATVTFIIKAFQHLLSFFYYGFFYNYDKMQIKIDEENKIQESYMELKNGKIIPINISRVSIKVPPIEENNETIEEDKNE